MSTRRDFIRSAALAGAGFTILPARTVISANQNIKLRLGFIGVGLRGQSHLELALRRNDVTVVALCDIQPRMMDMALQLVSKAGKSRPQVILEGHEGYKLLLGNSDIDAVIISTPWE